MTEGLENLPAPPPLPERDRRPGLWCWPVIVGAVLAIALMPYLDSAAREQTETEDGLSQLAVLQLQSRLLIGLSAIDRAQVAKELDELNELITDDRSAAVALVHAFVGEKEGREKAVAILERQAGEEGGETPLTEWARKALDVGVTPAERAMLSQHLGWFAHLMPASGEDGGGAVPRADEIRRSGLISMFITAGLTLLVILALMTGVILLVYVLARKRRGEFSTAFDRTRLPARIFLESFAIFMAAIGLGSVGGLFLNPLVQIALVLGGLACGLLWPRIRGLSWRETRKSLGWHRGRGFSAKSAPAPRATSRCCRSPSPASGSARCWPRWRRRNRWLTRRWAACWGTGRNGFFSLSSPRFSRP